MAHAHEQSHKSYNVLLSRLFILGKPLATIHAVTYLAVFVVAFTFLILNLSGQVILEPHILDGGQYGPHWENLYEHCEHGWPLTYAQRVLSPLTGPTHSRLSLWRIDEGAKQFRLVSLFVDAAIAVGVLVLVGIIVERHRRRTTRFQVSLRGALLAMGVIAVVLGLYVMHRAGHYEECRVLETIEHTPRDSVEWGTDIHGRVEWTRVGPTWLRQLIGEDYFRAFNRVAAIDTDGVELSQASKLRSIKVVRIHGGASNRELKFLEALPELEALDLGFAQVHETIDQDSDEDGAPCFELPRLPKLRGVNLHDTSFRGAGLTNVPRLEVLWATDTEIDNRALVEIGQLRGLRTLTIANTRITDEGMRHLSSLAHLEELWMDDNDIADAGIEHLAGLKSLRTLSLSGCNVSDASIPILRGLPALEYLDISGNQLTKFGASELTRALSRCKVVVD